jgi:hypothetical protein
MAHSISLEGRIVFWINVLVIFSCGLQSNRENGKKNDLNSKFISQNERLQVR